MFLLKFMTIFVIFISAFIVFGGLMEIGNPASKLSIPERLGVIIISASPVMIPIILTFLVGMMFDAACNSHLRAVEERYGNNS